MRQALVRRLASEICGASAVEFALMENCATFLSAAVAFTRIMGAPPPQITRAKQSAPGFDNVTRTALSVMDYNGLVAADLDLLDFMHALAGEIGIAAGTYDSVLKADMTLGDVLNAAADVAGGQGAAAAQMALNRLRPGVSTFALDGTKLLGLGEMGGLSIGERPSGLSGSNVLTKISALDLVRAAVGGLVSPLGAVLEPVLQSLLDALGVGLGEADVRVHGVRCGAPALVM